MDHTATNGEASNSGGSRDSVSDKEKIRRLEAQVFQLRNVIVKLTGQESQDGKRAKSGRAFDFSLYKKRHVLLQIAYFGWDFFGYALQEITGKTIESELFRALLTTRLIESRETSNYHRCGRTDKGVSAFRQVISIDVRTNLLQGPGVFGFEGCKAEERHKTKGNSSTSYDVEIDFCKILNAQLPPQIQVTAWAPCYTQDFSARFDCKQRTYKYFFPKGNLDLNLMQEAGKKLVGGHDFRNFCKMDVANGVVNYIRSISDVRVTFFDDSPSRSDDSYRMCVVTIVGKAYLWHQIRCIVAVLFRVGAGLESPDVIDELLDVEKHPRRPQYTLASDFPLNLFDCKYEEVDEDGNLRVGEWVYDMNSLEQVVRDFQTLWSEYSIKATMAKACLDEVEKIIESNSREKVLSHNQSIVSFGNSKKSYVPLMEMMKCPSLEEKLETSQGRKRRRNEEETE